MDYKLSLSFEEPVSIRSIEPFFSGVGMIRGEYLLRKTGKYITMPEIQIQLREYLLRVADMFYPRDVRYRTIEFPSNWISKLEGADAQLHEDDFMMATRGIRRSLRYPDTFMTEVEIVSNVAKSYDNLHILLPFVTNPSEMREAKYMIRGTGFANKIGMMVEIPAAVLTLEDFCEEGIDYLTVGSNDLTSFTLASSRSLNLYDRTHPAVSKLLGDVVRVGRNYNIETILGGDISPEMDEIGKTIGFDSITLFVRDVPVIFPHLNTPQQFLNP